MTPERRAFLRGRVAYLRACNHVPSGFVWLLVGWLDEALADGDVPMTFPFGGEDVRDEIRRVQAAIDALAVPRACPASNSPPRPPDT